MVLVTVLATDLALAVVLGSAFGVGVCLLLALVPRWGAPSLTRRVAPYLRDITDPRGMAFVPEPFGLRALLRVASNSVVYGSGDRVAADVATVTA